MIFAERNIENFGRTETPIVEQLQFVKYTDSEGNPLPRVSSIIQQSLPTPKGLMDWKIRMATMDSMNASDINAFVRHAADIGTACHEFIEEDLYAAFHKRPARYRTNLPAGVEEQALFARSNWAELYYSVKRFEPLELTLPDTKEKILGLEVSMTSERHKFAGTADFIGKMGVTGNKIFIGDWKTSSIIGKREQTLQAGAYAILLQENFGITVDGAFIARMEKNRSRGTGRYEMICLDQEELRAWAKGFLALLEKFYVLYEAEMAAEGRPKSDWLLDKRIHNITPFLKGQEEENDNSQSNQAA